ncbi:FAD-binding oxidoreductase [Cellulomonas wangsupingiae]|uniref:FAD-dependent oxidoreductase n=1 Tax=Cellulomonas wangsupingiae TaxID=2968085 RepID=A0ABY5K3H7_9CELL|nr:FAD-dependent oxidoreductase [Cellulomonas wangsupingiae]MCC2333750.1 FAD-dependent oxidoreductase [Cellulomonas wangsupingiae]UUI65012.1 FAD-dependent oxidoreductase [Cellulomonas wangsupingiae]
MDLPHPAREVTSTSVPTRVDGLADALDGLVPVHRPGTPEHAALSAAVNPARPRRPALVAAPRTPQEVAHVVRLAGEHGVRVGVQGTGHGRSAPLDDAVLVSTVELDHLTVLPALGRAHVGAGVRWAQVVADAARYGLAPVCGSAPSVGVVGYLTGGGHGPLARTLGVSSDRVLALDVVTGDGVLRRATPVEEPDLFWGLRGGRGALGVVVAVELELVDQPTLYGGALWSADVERVVHAWAAWAPGLPAQASTSLAVMRLPALPGVPEALAGRTTVAVRFAWTGDPEAGASVLAPLRAVAPLLEDTVAVMPYAAIGSIHGDPDAPVPVHESHLLLEDLGPEASERLVELVGPGSPCAQVVVEVRHLGGAASRQPTVPDAVPSRAAAWSLFTVGMALPATVDAVAADAARIAAALAPWTRPGGLPNFTPGDGPGWAERVYPPPTRHRLAEVSRRYDPDGVLLAAHAFRTP